jgi:hypothetical protein
MVQSQRPTTLLLANNKPFLELQPFHEDTQHITAYGPSLGRRPLMNACRHLLGTAYDQSCSAIHLGCITTCIGPGEDT